MIRTTPTVISERNFELIITPNSCDFITTWQTTAPNQEIRILTAGEGYNYNINWGDGDVTNGATGNVSHSYSSPGVYQVVITGDFPRIVSLNNPTASLLRSIEQWGCHEWESMEDAFANCSSLVINAPDTPNLSNVVSMRRMFYGAASIGSGTGNWVWDTSNVVDMSQLFQSALVFNEDISFWNTGNVINFSKMFYETELFNQDIDNWNVSKATNMDFMFYDASKF